MPRSIPSALAALFGLLSLTATPPAVADPAAHKQLARDFYLAAKGAMK